MTLSKKDKKRFAKYQTHVADIMNNISDEEQRNRLLAEIALNLFLLNLQLEGSKH